MPTPGSPDDPAYKSKTALVYQRHKRLLEPLNLPLNFTNTILEKGVPQRFEQFQQRITLDESSIDIAKRRINWCLNNDSAMRKLPIRRTFPYLDQRPPRVWGVTENRKENHLLITLNDLANQNASKLFGVNSDVVLQRITNLNCVLSFERDQKNVLMNLESDFVTLLQNIKPNIEAKLPEFGEKNSSSKNELASIHPLTWEIGFDSKNFYTDKTEFSIPNHSAIQTIYLSNNNVVTRQDIDFQGRAIMFCYGYAVQQAKLRYNTKDFEQIQLESPINIQCIFSNPTNYKIGSVLFELNSLNPSDVNNRNRAWILPVNSVLDDVESVLKNVVTLNSNGVHF